MTEEEKLLAEIEKRGAAAFLKGKEEIKAELNIEFAERGFLTKEGAEELAESKFTELQKRAAEDENSPSKLVERLSTKITEIEKNAQKRTPKGFREALKAQIEEQGIDFRKAAGNKEYVGYDDGHPALEIRAGDITVGGNSNGSTNYPGINYLPGLGELPRVSPFIEDYVTKGTVPAGDSRVVFTEKTNRVNNASMTTEGGLVGMSSFSWADVEIPVKDVTDGAKVSTRILQDINFMPDEILKEMIGNVKLKANQQILTGTGDNSAAALELKGLKSQVGGFVLTGLEVQAPNFFDCIDACVAQIQNANGEMATHVFVNIIDFATARSLKDTQNRLLSEMYIEFTNGRYYRNGVEIVVTNNFPQGEILVCNASKIHVDDLIPFAWGIGLENDDWTRRRRTFVGERRLASYVRTNELINFVWDNLSVIKAAILKP